MVCQRNMTFIISVIKRPETYTVEEREQLILAQETRIEKTLEVTRLKS